MDRHTTTAVELVKTMFSARENVLVNPALKYLTRYVERMDRHTVTAVKLVIIILSAKGNVLVNPVLKYSTLFVERMERHTATAVKPERTMLSARENVLAKKVKQSKKRRAKINKKILRGVKMPCGPLNPPQKGLNCILYIVTCHPHLVKLGKLR